MEQKIQELRNKAMPIIYRDLSISTISTLEKRISLLDSRVVEGYGCIWGSRNGHGEKFLKGAFTKSINDNGPASNANYQIKFRNEHDKVCALFDELKEDKIGLYFKTKPLDNVEWCDELLIQLRSGSINNFSVGFKPLWDKTEYDSENDIIVYKEAKLFEISSAGIPSDTETYALRSLEAENSLDDDIEAFILTLPKQKQLEGRNLITRCISLERTKPPSVLREVEPKHNKLDYSYIINNLKIK